MIDDIDADCNSRHAVPSGSVPMPARASPAVQAAVTLALPHSDA